MLGAMNRGLDLNIEGKVKQARVVDITCVLEWSTLNVIDLNYLSPIVSYFNHISGLEVVVS